MLKRVWHVVGGVCTYGRSFTGVIFAAAWLRRVLGLSLIIIQRSVILLKEISEGSGPALRRSFEERSETARLAECVV